MSGGLTLNGVIHLNGSSASVRSFGNQTFGGAGTISFEGTTGSARLLTIEGTSTLTLASGFTVAGGLGTVGDWWESGGASTLINNGTISANVSGQTLTLHVNSDHTNAGALQSFNGGTLVANNLTNASTGTAVATNSTLTLGGAWTNAGSITITGSTLNLGGTFANTDLGTINRTGGVVNLTGTLTNTGSTLTLNAATGSWNFFGTIIGGTVVFADGAALVISTNNTTGTFTNGVTLNGDLTVSGTNTGLRVSGGLTLNGVIHLNGSSASVRSFGNQTFGGAGTISFEGTTGSARLLTIEGTSTLTLASGFTVAGGLGTVGDWWESGGASTLINNGTISANVSGQTLTLHVNSDHTNAGALQSFNGGTLVANNLTNASTGTAVATNSTLTLGGAWTNAGSITITGSTLNLGGTFANTDLGTINRTGGVVNLTGTLTNTGSTLTLNAATGSWNFFGTIIGGTVVFADLMRIGGVSGWLRAAPVAAAAGIQVSTHLYPEVAAHLMRVTETAHWLEWQDWADPILKQPFPVKSGYIELPNVPGIGIEWDEGSVERYRY